MLNLKDEMGILSESKVFTRGIVPGLSVAGFLLTGASSILRSQAAKVKQEKRFEEAVSKEVEKRLKDVKELSS